MKEFIADNQVEILIGSIVGGVLLFIVTLVCLSNKQDMEMARLGMCASKIEGSQTTYWKPCKQ